MVLVHPREARRTIGTAPIVRICIPETILIQGTGPELDQSPRLQAILADPSLDPWLLFPGPQAIEVSTTPRQSGKRLAILVVDGTWPQAKKMIKTSRLLQSLPCMAFEPAIKSSYGFRKQPADFCLSTAEAVHEVITRLSSQEGARPQDTILKTFAEMVSRQLNQARQLGPITVELADS